MVINYNKDEKAECENKKKAKDYFCLSNHECQISIPPTLGRGFFKYRPYNQGCSMSYCNFTLEETLALTEESFQDNSCTLSFCLSGGFDWKIQDSKNTFSIDKNESIIAIKPIEECITVFETKVHYHSIGITFDPHQFELVGDALDKIPLMGKNNISGLCEKKHAITPNVYGILQQIINVNMNCGVKDIYLEGKTLELIAVYLDEMVYENGNGINKTNLSKEDITSLKLAKEIVDKNYIHPLTLTQIAKQVYINEYKLKRGFKEMYGKTVYQYIIDKKMELAKTLIEQKKFNVSYIAEMVGYVNVSHFIDVFKAHYGITPGKYVGENHN